MFRNKKARWSSFVFMFVVLIIPMASLLIMNDQLSAANSITGAAAADASEGNAPIFAGLLIIALVVVGLVSLFFKFHTHVKTKRVVKEDINERIDNLAEELKKL